MAALALIVPLALAERENLQDTVGRYILLTSVAISRPLEAPQTSCIVQCPCAMTHPLVLAAGCILVLYAGLIPPALDGGQAWLAHASK